MTDTTIDPLAEFRRLPVHSDDTWTNIAPGHWEPMTCADYEKTIHGTDLAVWSAITDPQGNYGREVFTLWGSRDDTVPGPASLALYDRRDDSEVTRCIHARYVPDDAAEYEDPRIADAEYERDHGHLFDEPPARWEP